MSRPRNTLPCARPNATGIAYTKASHHLSNRIHILRQGLTPSVDVEDFGMTVEVRPIDHYLAIGNSAIHIGKVRRR
jgi:hypothetical protein